MSKLPELTRKHISDMYFNEELELEIRNPDQPRRMAWNFTKNSDREVHVEKIVAEYLQHIITMSPSCISRGKLNSNFPILCVHKFKFNIIGCDHCFSMDGNWKLCFTHCMFPVTAGVMGLPSKHS